MRKYSAVLLAVCMLFAFCACQTSDYAADIVGDWQKMDGNSVDTEGEVFVFTESGFMYEKGYAGIMQSTYTVKGNQLTVSIEHPTTGEMITNVNKIKISGDTFTMYLDDGGTQKFKRIG